MAGLSEQQAHRVLEDFQRLGQVFNIMNLKSDECPNSKICKAVMALAKDESDAIYNDIKGMLNGNNKEIPNA